MGQQRTILKGVGTKIGRLPMSVARKAGLQCADIYLSDTYLKHISNKHKREIEKVGLTPEDFVRYIVKEYNRIVSGSEGSIMLVVYRKEERTALCSSPSSNLCQCFRCLESNYIRRKTPKGHRE